MNSLAAGALLLGAAAAPGQVNLHPRESSFEIDGLQQARLEMRDGQSRIFYQPPAGWSHRSLGATGFELSPPGTTGVLASIQAVESGFSTKAEGILADILRTLPKGASEVQITREPLQSLKIANAAVPEWQVKYKLGGTACQRSVLVMTFEYCQFRFSITAPAAEFELRRRVFVSSLGSWHWEPGP